jgi:hypothetical protein
MNVLKWLTQRPSAPSAFASRASFRTKSWRPSLLAALGLWGAVVWAKPAAAELTLGLDVSANKALDQLETGRGGGVDIHVGPRIDVWIFQITPELSAGLHDFGGFQRPTVMRGLVGGKVALDLGIKPTFFAHFGAGRLRYDSIEEIELDSATGIAADFGAALDLNVLPRLDVGVQGSYNVVGADQNWGGFDWVQVGGHVTVILDWSRS